MPALRFSRPLRFGDCDLSGIAYFPAYMGMLADALELLFAAAGVPFTDLMGRRRLGTPTVRLDVRFTRPGFHGDSLDWEVGVERLGTRSAGLLHRVSAAGAGLWSARQVIVLTDLASHRPVPWPADMREGLLRYTRDEADECDPAT